MVIRFRPRSEQGVHMDVPLLSLNVSLGHAKYSAVPAPYEPGGLLQHAPTVGVGVWGWVGGREMHPWSLAQAHMESGRLAACLAWLHFSGSQNNLEAATGICAIN
jgi:hypothetical protein